MTIVIHRENVDSNCSYFLSILIVYLKTQLVSPPPKKKQTYHFILEYSM